MDQKEPHCHGAEDSPGTEGLSLLFPWKKCRRRNRASSPSPPFGQPVTELEDLRGSCSFLRCQSRRETAGTGQHRQLPYSLHHHQPLSRTPQPICQCSRPLPAHGHSQYCRADPLCPQSSRVHLQTRLHLQKAGVVLSEIRSAQNPQLNLFVPTEPWQRNKKDHPGHGQNQPPAGAETPSRYGAQGMSQAWQLRREYLPAALHHPLGRAAGGEDMILVGTSLASAFQTGKAPFILPALGKADLIGMAPFAASSPLWS